jgi:hypothetical protein
VQTYCDTCSTDNNAKIVSDMVMVCSEEVVPGPCLMSFHCIKC